MITNTILEKLKKMKISTYLFFFIKTEIDTFFVTSSRFKAGSGSKIPDFQFEDPDS